MHLALRSLCVSTTILALACGRSDGDGGVGDEVDSTDGETGTETLEGDGDSESSESADTSDDATTDESTSDDATDTDTSDATDTDTDTATDTDTTDATDTDGGGQCGNGIIEGGEECDDGNLSNDDGCLASCANATCGDTYINMGVEVCDDGINDGSYGGCSADCQDFGPYCGDGTLDMPEDCDDANADLADGCQTDCVIPQSCLTLLTFDDTLTDGQYLIAPVGYVGDPFAVWCDMVSDGGGYTFLKIDAGAQTFAAAAETECTSWGMQLWIPRSVDHKDSGWIVANDNNIGPGSSPDYMRILGIYPNFNGAACANQAMNSGNPGCQWDASDDAEWFVHDVNNISEPNGDNTTTGSMYYQWQGNGAIQWHNDIGGNGYSSAFFMCDVADKLP